MRILRAAFCAALFMISAPALAQDITLTSRDGALSIGGTLVGFDGEFYRIDTEYGRLTVDRTGVNCTGPGCPELQNYVAEVTVAGARGPGENLLPALLARFASERGLTVSRHQSSDQSFSIALTDPKTSNDLARIVVRLGSSDQGIAALIAGDAQLALSLREANTDEIEAALEAGAGALNKARNARIIGLDGIVPIVAPQNPVRAISLADLGAVLRGDITNWQDLGGIDAPILLHMPSPVSGISRVVRDELIAGEAISATPQAHERTSELADAVARDPFALGVGVLSDTANGRALELLGGCGFPFRATAQAIKSEDYPLTAPLFLYTSGQRMPKIIREFLAFAGGEQAAKVVESQGFVNLSTVETDVTHQGARLANAVLNAGDDVPFEDLQAMVTELRPSARLSTTFRFEPGSSRLDAQSRSAVAQLALMLETGDFAHHRMIFAGFSDGDGGADANKRVALRRARVVRAAVLKAATLFDPKRLEIDALGFGEVMPMACDETEWGRRVNRRVEVWLVPNPPQIEPGAEATAAKP